MYRGRWVAQTVIHQYLLDNVIWWLIEQFYALCVEIARTVHGRFVCKNPVECVNVVFVWAYGPKQSRSAYLQSKTYVHGINNSVNTGQNQDFVRCMRQTNAKSCCNMYSEIDKRRTQTHKQTRHWLNRSLFFGYEKFRTYVADKDRYWVLKFAFSLWHCVFVPPLMMWFDQNPLRSQRGKRMETKKKGPTNDNLGREPPQKRDEGGDHTRTQPGTSGKPIFPHVLTVLCFRGNLPRGMPTRLQWIFVLNSVLRLNRDSPPWDTGGNVFGLLFSSWKKQKESRTCF